MAVGREAMSWRFPTALSVVGQLVRRHMWGLEVADSAAQDAALSAQRSASAVAAEAE